MVKDKRVFTSGTRLTKDEFNLLSDAAASVGLSLSEWIRQTTLRAAKPKKSVPPKKTVADTLLEEVMYIEEMLSIAIPALAGGKSTSKEQIKSIFQQLRNRKYDVAKNAVQALARRK
jgi:hypothetical protein